MSCQNRFQKSNKALPGGSSRENSIKCVCLCFFPCLSTVRKAWANRRYRRFWAIGPQNQFPSSPPSLLTYVYVYVWWCGGVCMMHDAGGVTTMYHVVSWCIDDAWSNWSIYLAFSTKQTRQIRPCGGGAVGGWGRAARHSDQGHKWYAAQRGCGSGTDCPGYAHLHWSLLLKRESRYPPHSVAYKTPIMSCSFIRLVDCRVDW